MKIQILVLGRRSRVMSPSHLTVIRSAHAEWGLGAQPSMSCYWSHTIFGRALDTMQLLSSRVNNTKFINNIIISLYVLYYSLYGG